MYVWGTREKVCSLPLHVADSVHFPSGCFLFHRFSSSSFGTRLLKARLEVEGKTVSLESPSTASLSVASPLSSSARSLNAPPN